MLINEKKIQLIYQFNKTEPNQIFISFWNPNYVISESELQIILI